MENLFFEINFVILLCFLSKISRCCLYEGQQVETLNNATFVEAARSTVECTLRCQRLKKTPFYTEEEKCYCVEAVEAQKRSNESYSGIIFKEVCNF